MGIVYGKYRYRIEYLSYEREVSEYLLKNVTTQVAFLFSFNFPIFFYHLSNGNRNYSEYI